MADRFGHYAPGEDEDPSFIGAPPPPPLPPNGTGHRHARGDADDRAPPNEPPPKDEKKKRFTFLNSADFARADYRREWLVRRLLVKGQPAVIGGPRKALKTSFLVDLALGLGTGTPVLGEFAVPQPVRVALLSGESGEGTLQETALRVAAAKGIDLETADVLWGFSLPQLANIADLAELQEALDFAVAEVVIIDPLYLSLLAGTGQQGPQASNIYQIGPLLLNVARACLKVGCTPILAHHFRLQRADHFGEPQLEELAYSGIQEFARQWVLLGRREKYVPNTGSHRLWLSVGGSAGHSGLWALDIDEGVIDDDFSGRGWDVAITTATEARENAQAERERMKQEERAKRDHDDETAVLVALDQIDPGRQGAGLEKLYKEVSISKARVQAAAERLVEAEILIPTLITAVSGNGAQKRAKGFKRVETCTDV